eukprot:4651742-Pleurochrysis_carterae.AAC.4
MYPRRQSAHVKSCNSRRHAPVARAPDLFQFDTPACVLLRAWLYMHVHARQTSECERSVCAGHTGAVYLTRAHSASARVYARALACQPHPRVRERLRG